MTTTVNLYMPRCSGKIEGVNGWVAMDRLIEVSKWVEAQFGRADYHTNYSLDFADWTDDWAAFRFYNPTQAFWTHERWGHWMLTQEQWTEQALA